MIIATRSSIVRCHPMGRINRPPPHYSLGKLGPLFGVVSRHLALFAIGATDLILVGVALVMRLREKTGTSK